MRQAPRIPQRALAGIAGRRLAGARIGQIWVICLFYLLAVQEYTLASPGARIAGKASYYTVKSCQREGTSGIYTANGEVYDETALTCALPSHQFGGLYRVCMAPWRDAVARDTSRAHCVVVRHNDYGPGRGAQRNGVVVDLTPTAFQAVCGNLSQGVCTVEVTEVRP